MTDEYDEIKAELNGCSEPHDGPEFDGPRPEETKTGGAKNQSIDLRRLLKDHGIAFQDSPAGGFFVAPLNPRKDLRSVELSSLQFCQGVAMTIDYETESIITFGEACRALPPNDVSDAMMARWIQRRVKVKSFGTFVKPGTLAFGGRRTRSREAISRFIAAQSADHAPVAPVITASQRRKQSETARTELKKMGVSDGASRTIARPTNTTTGVAQQ